MAHSLVILAYLWLESNTNLKLPLVEYYQREKRTIWYL